MPKQHRKTTTADSADKKLVTTAQMPGKNTRMQQLHKMGHFARVCRSKNNSTRKQKINYLEETYNEEEESEPEEVQQITQINRVLPDENDNYGIKLKFNGKYQNFTIDTGSPVTIMPNN